MTINPYQCKQHEITKKDIFDRMLAQYSDMGVSDFMILSRRPIKAKLHGYNERLTDFSVTETQVNQIAESIYGGPSLSSMLFGKGLPCSYTFRYKNERYRYRVNIIREYNGIFLVLRPIDAIPPTIEQLSIEPEIVDSYVRLIDPNDNHIAGSCMILAGETGSGKSSTIAACNRYILEKSKIRDIGINIYTAENPIEYIYTSVDEKNSVIGQTEVPKNMESFKEAIFQFLRMDPNVIIVGEVRDYETLDAFVKSSESGHVGVTTIHANSVSQVVSRMIGLIPEQLRTENEIRKVLSLMGIVVFQKLLRRKEIDSSTKKGGRVAIREYLIFTKEVQDYLLNNLHDLDRATQHCVEKFGRSYQSHFKELVDKGQIDVAA